MARHGWRQQQRRQQSLQLFSVSHRSYSTPSSETVVTSASSATATPSPSEAASMQPPAMEPLSAAASGIGQDTTNHGAGAYEWKPTFGVEHEVIEGGYVDGQWFHITAIQDFLNTIHDTVGLPWWASIALTTITFRLCVLPLNIALIRNSARLGVVRNELDAQAKLIQENEQEYVERVHGTGNKVEVSSEEITQELEDSKLEAAARVDELFKKHKCNPLLNIASPILMAPLFLSVWMAVERICLHDPQAAIQGLLWFPNLAVPDPTFLLPMLSGLTWILTIELGCDTPRTENMKLVRSGLRFLAAAMIPVCGAIPSGVFVYWLTSNAFSLCQIITLQRFSGLRRMLGIPPRTMSAIQQKTKPISLS